MKKNNLKKKLTLNKKTIQYLTKTGMQKLYGGETRDCYTQTCTCTYTCDTTTTNGGLSPQTICVGGTTVTISACNTGGGGGGTLKC